MKITGCIECGRQNGAMFELKGLGYICESCSSDFNRNGRDIPETELPYNAFYRGQKVSAILYREKHRLPPIKYRALSDNP